MEEERHVDGDQQVVPLCVRHLEVNQKLRTTGYSPVFASGHSVEEGGTSFAGTDDLSRGNLNQVRMLMCHSGTAQLAPFDGTPWARELAKGRKRLI
jgi:hypothetical protein